MVAFAQKGVWFLCDVGYCNVQAFARIAAAGAYFCSRLNHQSNLYETVAGRLTPIERVSFLHTVKGHTVEKDLVMGAKDQGGARLIACRVPELSVHERRRKARKNAKKKGYTPSQAHLTLFAWTLFLTNVPCTTWKAETVIKVYPLRWQVGVSSEGHSVQSVEVRPRLKDSGLVAWEAPWRENKTVEPSDNRRRKAHAQHTRLQRAVNAAVASSHAIPVAETVDNARRQQGLSARSPIRQLSPAGYQRRHGVKETVSTGEALGVRRSNLAEEAVPITVRGKWRRRHQGGGSGRSTVDGRAAQRARREGPGPVSTPFVQVRQG